MHTEWKVIATVSGVPYPTDDEYTAFSDVVTGALTQHDGNAEEMRVEFFIYIEGDSSTAATEEGRSLLREALTHFPRANPDVRYFRVFRINEQERT